MLEYIKSLFRPNREVITAALQQIAVEEADAHFDAFRDSYFDRLRKRQQETLGGWVEPARIEGPTRKTPKGKKK